MHSLPGIIMVFFTASHGGREQGREKVDVEREALDDDHDISGHGADMSCSSIMSRRLVSCDDASYIPLHRPARPPQSPRRRPYPACRPP